MVFTNILVPSGPPLLIRKRLSINSNIGHLIRQDWVDKCTLLQEMIELREYIEGSPGTGQDTNVHLRILYMYMYM